VASLITAELTKKIDLLSEDAYSKVEDFVEQLIMINAQGKKEQAFKVFMDKMDAAEKSVQEQGYYSEEEVERELTKV
jgi:glutathionyl-hydroquinone reductase